MESNSKLKIYIDGFLVNNKLEPDPQVDFEISNHFSIEIIKDNMKFKEEDLTGDDIHEILDFIKNSDESLILAILNYHLCYNISLELLCETIDDIEDFEESIFFDRFSTPRHAVLFYLNENIPFELYQILANDEQYLNKLADELFDYTKYGYYFYKQ